MNRSKLFLACSPLVLNSARSAAWWMTAAFSYVALAAPHISEREALWPVAMKCAETGG